MKYSLIYISLFIANVTMAACPDVSGNYVCKGKGPTYKPDFNWLVTQTPKTVQFGKGESIINLDHPTVLLFGDNNENKETMVAYTQCSVDKTGAALMVVDFQYNGQSIDKQIVTKTATGFNVADSLGSASCTKN